MAINLIMLRNVDRVMMHVVQGRCNIALSLCEYDCDVENGSSHYPVDSQLRDWFCISSGGHSSDQMDHWEKIAKTRREGSSNYSAPR